jgi:hypothetical protein
MNIPLSVLLAAEKNSADKEALNSIHVIGDALGENLAFGE